MLLFTMFALSGCDVIGDIFGAGFYTGIIVVVIIIVLLIVVFFKFLKK